MSLSSLNCKDSSSSLNVLNLPNDLLLNCLARVSRSYYPTLSLVSKRFRSLVTSLELYETRTLLGRTESCLYACLPFPPVSNSMRWFTLQFNEHNSRWFTPCLPPSRLENKKNVLVSGPPRNFDSCCVIDNVLYCGDRMGTGKIEWFDLEGRTWRVLKGVTNLDPYIKLVNNGGKIAVFWEEDFLNINIKKKKFRSHKKMIWCAVISLERRNKKEIRGKVEWRNVVFSIPKLCDVKFIAATV